MKKIKENYNNLEDIIMMKNSVIHVLFLMVAFVSVFGGMAISAVCGQSFVMATAISLITVALAIMICLVIGKLRREA